MGSIADQYLPDALNEEVTVQILEDINMRFPAYIETAEQAEGNPGEILRLGYVKTDLQNILTLSI